MATMLISMLTGCGGDERSAAQSQPAARAAERLETAAEGEASFRVEAERFADVRVLRYRAPGFEALAPKAKGASLLPHEAALSGREIIYDQKYRYNSPFDACSRKSSALSGRPRRGGSRLPFI
jgi:hypothetical protein